MDTAYTEGPKAPNSEHPREPDRPRRSTVLGIPCPWSGNDEHTPLAYRAWYRLYRTTRVLRHKLRLHDWHPQTVWDPKRKCCTWCGHRPTRTPI